MRKAQKLKELKENLAVGATQPNSVYPDQSEYGKLTFNDYYEMQPQNAYQVMSYPQTPSTGFVGATPNFATQVSDQRPFTDETAEYNHLIKDNYEKLEFNHNNKKHI